MRLGALALILLGSSTGCRLTPDGGAQNQCRADEERHVLGAALEALITWSDAPAGRQIELRRTSETRFWSSWDQHPDNPRVSADAGAAAAGRQGSYLQSDLLGRDCAGDNPQADPLRIALCRANEVPTALPEPVSRLKVRWVEEGGEGYRAAFSRAVISEGCDRALVWGYYLCGPLCSAEALIELTKVDGVWKQSAFMMFSVT